MSKDTFRFKPFRETYTKITFALCLGMIYPAEGTARWRFLGILLTLASVAPMGGIILFDMCRCCLERDIVNLIRHSTVFGPFLGGFFKMVVMFYKSTEAKQILDEIDRDYENFNYLSDEYRQLAARAVYNSRIYCERVWVAIVMTCVMVFPVMAIISNIYNTLFAIEPTKRYMIHEIRRPLAEDEAMFDSPFFEIVFVYQFYCSILYVINYTGVDGFFGLCMNHACLKIELFCKELEDAMTAAPDKIHEKIVAVIEAQNRMYQFVDSIQEAFNIWLGLIFFATMIQICTCMYHISEGYGFDLRYMIFVMGAIIHIYLPCRYASKLKSKSSEIGTRYYCSGWENVHSSSVKKMLPFMVARGQTPLGVNAFNMVSFDMELFVSMMQTSYSMFTLLRTENSN